MKLCLMNLGEEAGAADGAGPPPAVPAAEVLEFCTDSPLTPVPLAPPLLAGIANFHGQIVPVINTARLLNPQAPPADLTAAEDSPFLVISGPLGTLGLQVISVDLVTLAEPAPADESHDSQDQDAADPENFVGIEEKSSPDQEKSAQFNAESAQKALFSEETQELAYKVLEESSITPGSGQDTEPTDASAQEEEKHASEPIQTNQTAPGIQGIFSRTLEIQERGVYRQLQTETLSRHLRELLGTVKEQG